MVWEHWKLLRRVRKVSYYALQSNIFEISIKFRVDWCITWVCFENFNFRDFHVSRYTALGKTTCFFWVLLKISFFFAKTSLYMLIDTLKGGNNFFQEKSHPLPPLIWAPPYPTGVSPRNSDYCLLHYLGFHSRCYRFDHISDIFRILINCLMHWVWPKPLKPRVICPPISTFFDVYVNRGPIIWPRPFFK